jgi:hypothetical protein
MPRRIQDFFKEYHRERNTPMILLVHKEEETMNFLLNMGVDVSRWRFGLRDLLMPEVRGASVFERLLILTVFFSATNILAE